MRVIQGRRLHKKILSFLEDTCRLSPNWFESINKGSQSRLTVDEIQNIGPHYSRTLRLWKERFMKNFDSRIRPALLSEYSGMTESDTALLGGQLKFSLRQLCHHLTEVLLVLFHLLRSRLQHQNSRRRDHHDKPRRSHGDVGGHTLVVQDIPEHLSTLY